MATTLNDLLNPPTAAQLKEELRQTLSKYGFAADDWNSGSTSRSLLESDAKALEDLWIALQSIAEGGYLDTATAGWLDLLAKSQYQLDRIPSEFTKGLMNLILDPALGGPYTFSAGALIVSDGTHTYRSSNTVPVTLNAANTKASIEFTAESPGSGFNILSGAINTSTTPSQAKVLNVGLTINNIGVQGPAKAIALYLKGPFSVSGKTFKIALTDDGTLLPLQTLTFPANYVDLASLVTGLNTLIAANPVLKPGANALVVASVNSTTGSLQLVTRKPVPPGNMEIGTNQGILIDFSGSANALIGYSSVYNTLVIGTSGWITQSGRDAETDPSLAARCITRWATLGTGTAAAFDFWARAASPFVQKTAVYANYLNGAIVPGAVTVYIAGSNSGLNLPPLNGTVQVVFDYINPRMPIMTQLYVGNADTLATPVTATVTIKSSADAAIVVNQINAEIQAYANDLQIGQIAYLDKINAALSCNPAVLTHTLISPLVNIIPQKNQLVTLGPVNFTVVVA